MKRIILSVLVLLFLSSCSVFKETSSYEEVEQAKDASTDEVYVFDETEESGNDANTTVKPEEIKNLQTEVDNTITETENKTGNNNVTETVVETVNEPVTTEEQTYMETVETPSNSYTTYESYSNGVSFYVQLGAFSTLNRAENFSSQISSEVPFDVSVTYNNSNGLYVVRSTPYATRSEAESVRDELKRNYKFRDSFIVTE